MSFVKTSKIGDDGVERFRQWYEYCHKVKLEKVEDLERQMQGFDLFQHEKKFRIEVKTEEASVTGNLFLEAWSNRTTKRFGWMWTSTANFLTYQFNTDNWFYWGDMPNLQEWFRANHENWPLRLQRKYVQNNDTWGRCVEIKHLLENGLIIRVPYTKKTILI